MATTVLDTKTFKDTEEANSRLEQARLRLSELGEDPHAPDA